MEPATPATGLAQRRRKALGVFIGMFIAWAAVDIALLAARENTHDFYRSQFEMIFLGLAAGQFSLLAAMLAWGEGGVASRLLPILAIGATIDVAMYGLGANPPFAATIVGFVFSMGVGVPFFLARWGGIAVRLPGDDFTAGHRVAQFRLIQLLMLTTAIAVVISILRVVPHVHRQAAIFGSLSAVMVGAIPVIVVPLVLSQPLPRRLLWLCGVILLADAVGTPFIQSYEWRDSLNNLALPMWYVVVLAMSLTVWITAEVWRSQGYRLVRLQATPANAETAA